MSQKSLTHRENVPVPKASESSFQTNRAKSALSIAVSSTKNRPEKNSQHSSGAETRLANSKNTTRNFISSFGASKEPMKKNYLKNSDKTIKPPEKPLKAIRPVPPAKQPTPLQREKTVASLARMNTIIKNTRENDRNKGATTKTSRLIASKRSLTFDNLNAHGSATTTNPNTRVDIRAIEECAKRLEVLQTIFMNKLDLFHSREPNSSKKAYKFVAIIVGDEAKLLVNESDAQRLPSTIPARSIEDLNIKIGTFFNACLIGFIDKLRLYQRENKPINCDEIYKELKYDEQVFCSILKDWVFEMSDEADTTLVGEPVALLEQNKKNFRDFGTQSDQCPLKQGDMTDEDFVDLIKLRSELNDIKLQLSRKEECYFEEMSKLKEQYELKVNDLNESLVIEQTLGAAKDEKINKIQESNDNLSQQIREANALLETLKKRHDELNAKLQNDADLTNELKKGREEFQNICQKNNDLNEMKTNFLRKLNQRATRIDLLEKEIKQLKRKIEVLNKEIEDLKLKFEGKVKENREYKDSLDARNQLIDHLRKAVEIEQRKRKECEENLINTANEGKKVSTGMHFNNATWEQKQLNKPADARRFNFNDFSNRIFTETMPGQVKGPLSEKPKEKFSDNKSQTEIKHNLFNYNMPKESPDATSSDEISTANQRFQQRKTHKKGTKKPC